MVPRPAVRVLAILLSCLVGAAARASTNDTTGTRATVRLDADPVNFAIGEFTLLETLASQRGPFPLDFRFYYGSARNTRRLPDGLPFKFAHNLHGTLVHDTAAGTIALEPGLAAEIAFRQVGADWVVAAAEPSRVELRESGDFYYVCDPLEETLAIYRRAATNGNEVVSTLRAVLDRNANRWIHGPPADPTGHGPALVSDTLGRTFTFQYNVVGVVDTAPYLTQVTDQGGRAWRFRYEENPPDAPGRVTLRFVIDPLGNTNRFDYFTNGFHFLHALTRPLGNVPSRQFYRTTEPGDAFRGLVTSQIDGRSNLWQVTAQRFTPLEDPVSRFTLGQPDGTTRGFVHDHFGRVTRRTVDEEGRAIEFEADPERDVFTGLVDRRGGVTRVRYHDSGRLAETVNARGFRTAFTYAVRTQVLVNPFNLEAVPCRFPELTRADHPDGTFEEFEYDERGNVRVARDRVGALTRFGYNAAGQIVARTNALGGVTTFAYDAAGNLVGQSDSDGVSQSYGYDAFFRRTSITNADASVVRFEYDALDHLVGIVDEAGVRFEMAYDANGNLTNLVRAAGTALAQTHRLSFDELDRLIRAVDPAGFATAFTHTYRGGIENTTFADGSVVRVGYDRRQIPVEVTDEAGHVARLQRDGEGLPTFLLTPSGRRFRAAFDPVGFPVELVDGRTNRFVLAYDPAQRLTNVVDRLGRGLALGRDGEGRLTSLRLPVVGTTHYARNALGQVTNLTDFRGASWQMEYTTMGRLAASRDPLGRAWTFAYDARGRASRLGYPDGVVETNRFDAVGSLIARDFSTGLTLTYGRDAFRRVVQTGSSPVQITYDARDRPLAVTQHGATFAADYDARGRLATLDYAGLGTITYTYDPRGLVTRVHDSRTGAFVEMDYDADRLLLRMRRSNGVVTEFEHDANAQVRRIHHVGRADLRLDRNAGDEITRLGVTGVLDVAGFLPDEALEFAYDAAHQLTPAGFAQDARGRRTRDPQREYAWDDADRLTSVTQGPTVIAQEFTARGDVAVETVGGVATEFFQHDAISGRPVLAERRGGAFRRYYVFTPGGALLFAVTLPANAPSFYHFNHAGTTVLLTDADGAVTDSYGYTPYGRPVRHEGPSDQPYTFHGRFGVRELGRSGVFHMGARFYDAWTARFLSRDPAWLDLLTSPGDLNPYGFARQNPVGFADPTGRQARVLFVNGEVYTGHEASLELGTLVLVREADGSQRFMVVGAAGVVNFGEIHSGVVLVPVDLTNPFGCRIDSGTPEKGVAMARGERVLITQPVLPTVRPPGVLPPNAIPAVQALITSVQAPDRGRPLPAPDRNPAPEAPRGTRLQLTSHDRHFGAEAGTCESYYPRCDSSFEENRDELRKAGYQGPFSLLESLPGPARVLLLRLGPLAVLAGLAWAVRRRGRNGEPNTRR